MVVSENLAAIAQLGAGDALTLATPTGPRRFEVYAVVTDYSSNQGWMLVDRRWYQEYWKDEQIDSVDLFFAPGLGHGQVANEVRKRLGDSEALFVTSQAGVRDRIQAAGRNLFAIAKAPELITLIVAIMGVIGTMLAAVIDRVRELGILRAVGALRAQVVQSVVVEAAFLGITAVFCGILAGIPAGLHPAQGDWQATSGWDLPYGFPLETAVRMALSVVAASALAGFLPGKRASSMDVKEALAYE